MRLVAALVATLIAASLLAGCGAGADGDEDASTAAAPAGATEVVTAYFDHFTHGRPAQAAALMHPVIVRECGGPEGMGRAIAEARSADPADYRVTEGTLQQDGDLPHVMARVEVRSPGTEPGAGTMAIGVARVDGRWYMAEIHPAQVSLACRI